MRSTRSTLGSAMAATGRWRSFSRVEEAPEYLDDMLTEARASLPPRVQRLARVFKGKLALGPGSVRPRGRQPASRTRDFSRRSLEHAPRQARRRSSLGLGAPAVPRPSARARRASAAFSSSTATRRTTPAAEASHADQIAGFRLNLDAGSAMTGVAKMAIIRDRHAEVVSARGPTKSKVRASDGKSIADWARSQKYKCRIRVVE